MHDDTVGVLAHGDNFFIVGRPPNRHIGVDLGEDRFDQIDRHIIAAKINYVKLAHLG
jgi:hypothetical protein